MFPYPLDVHKMEIMKIVPLFPVIFRQTIARLSVVLFHELQSENKQLRKNVT